jgi:hypothetical protein
MQQIDKTAIGEDKLIGTREVKQIASSAVAHMDNPTKRYSAESIMGATRCRSLIGVDRPLDTWQRDPPLGGGKRAREMRHGAARRYPNLALV